MSGADSAVKAREGDLPRIAEPKPLDWGSVFRSNRARLWTAEGSVNRKPEGVLGSPGRRVLGPPTAPLGPLEMWAGHPPRRFRLRPAGAFVVGLLGIVGAVFLASYRLRGISTK